MRALIEELRNFPFISNDTITNLARELPFYLGAGDGVTVSCENDKLTWWQLTKGTSRIGLHWPKLYC